MRKVSGKIHRNTCPQCMSYAMVQFLTATGVFISVLVRVKCMTQTFITHKFFASLFENVGLQNARIP